MPTKKSSPPVSTIGQEYKKHKVAIDLMQQKLTSSIQNLNWETAAKPELLVKLANINDLQEELEIAILNFRRVILTR